MQFFCPPLCSGLAAPVPEPAASVRNSQTPRPKPPTTPALQSNSINWDNVRNAIPSAPRFLFQNNDGFAHQTSDGSYSWIMPQFGNYGLDYLSSFYGTGLGFDPTVEERRFSAA